MLDQIGFKCDQLVDQIRVVFDFSVRILDAAIKKIGPNGYLLYGILSNTLFFGASMVLKLCPQFDWSVCVVVRGIVTLASSFLLSRTNKKDITFRGDELKYSSIRNTLIACQQVFFFYVVVIVPIKITWIINNMGPIFVFVLSYFIKGTNLSMRDVGFLIVSLIGINIITAPQLFLKAASLFFPIEAEEFVGEMDAYQMFIAFMFFSSISLWAFGIIYITFCKTITSVAINFSFALHLTLIGSVTLIARADEITMPSISDLIFLAVFVGLPNFLSSILFIHGSIVATDQGMFALTNYIPVFFSYGYQILYQNRTPQLLELVGIILTFFGLFKVVTRAKKPAPSALTAQTGKDAQNETGQQQDKDEIIEDINDERLSILTEAKVNQHGEEHFIHRFHSEDIRQELDQSKAKRSSKSNERQTTS